MPAPELSLTEWSVLGLLAEGPAHGFAIARQLEPGTELGRVLTVHRPLVYRALERLVGAGLAQPRRDETASGGRRRIVHAITPSGRRELRLWLVTPVRHVRDLRLEFLVKVLLVRRAGGDAGSLAHAQREQLAATLAALAAQPEGCEGTDVVDRWRSHSARAALAFLDELAGG